MFFAHGQTVLRDRRPQIADPYDPSRTIPGDWDAATTVTIEGAAVLSDATSAIPDGARSELASGFTLFCSDPAADVQVGDRIRAGGMTLYVNSLPSSDVNPFTGWQPVREVPLDHTLG
jgi:hypothetical protein